MVIQYLSNNNRNVWSRTQRSPLTKRIGCVKGLQQYRLSDWGIYFLRSAVIPLAHASPTHHHATEILIEPNYLLMWSTNVLIQKADNLLAVERATKVG